MPKTPPDPALQSALRSLPSVEALVGMFSAEESALYSHGRRVAAVRNVLDTTRAAIKSGDLHTIPPERLIQQVRDLLSNSLPHPRRVINATGVILHTNLGRAPLSESAQHAVIEAAAGYTDLEFNLDTGGRGKRESHLETQIAELVGAEAATVVNNNAAATLLMLTALAAGRDVILSRGQLVEIGGGFRVPDVMAQSGAHLIEVGTTNRTRIADFERAITAQTAILLRVHSSNFKMIGFTAQPTLAEIAELAHKRGVIAADDLGSGALLDTSPYGLEREPTLADSLEAGFDVVAFSGDKLLGGPQAGIIVGKRAQIELIKRHPLARAVRIDKLCLAALAATLDHYRYGEYDALPVWRMIRTPLDQLQARAEHWLTRIQTHHPSARVTSGRSTIGGGSLPGETLPTFLLAIPAAGTLAERYMGALREQPIPVIARVADGELQFDPRTVYPEQEDQLIAAINRLA